MYKIKIGECKLEFDNLEEDKKEKRLNFIKHLLSSFAIGLVIFSIVFFISWFNGLKSWVYYFSNACFVSGVLLAAKGLLSFVKKEGFFDVAQFGIKQFGESFKYAVTMKRDARVDTDIIRFKEEKRRNRVVSWDALIVGVLFITLSIVSANFV